MTSFYFFLCFVARFFFFFFFFFFSSRRRHTRCLSDWSSDVCSSDLRAARTGDIPGDGRGRRQWRAERTAAVGVTLVGEVVAEHGNFPGLRAAREGDAGVGGPVGALVVEVIDDIELDLVLPGIVCPQQQIPRRRRDLVAAGEERLQPRGPVEGVAREVLHRTACKRCVQETLVARICPAKCSLERGARRKAPQRLELRSAD